MVEGKLGLYKKTISNLFDCAGTFLKEDFSNVVVSVGFVSEDEIKNLNQKFRNIDKVTDVLSFPNLDKKADEKLSNFASEVVEGQLFLGDIVICKPQAKRQAKEYEHSLKRELCFLALHGLLHLLGYDHIEKEDEKLMQSTAEKILTEFGVGR